MNIEDEVFKKYYLNVNKLLRYGFIKDNNIYTYSCNILDDTFRVFITVTTEGKVKGKIFDNEMDEEYTNFRIEAQNGEFVNSVRDAYRLVLSDIAQKCFDKRPFIYEQANRLTLLIKEKFGDDPEFPWDDLDGSGVFRNPRNRKWYGLIMNINKKKLDGEDREVEVLNVKLDEEEIQKLIKKKGYYTCYHMNKKKWITIILDDTLSDEIIMEHLTESHNYTVNPNEWLVPANPSYYDIIGHFEKEDITTWKQSSDVLVGDIVYMYVGSPYSSLMYKCVALEVNIPCSYKDKNVSMSRLMKLKLLEKYDKDQYSLDELKKYGIKSVRGPRHVPKKLSNELNKKKK